LIESHKLDPRPLDEDPRSIEAKLRWHLHGTNLEGNSISPDQKIELVSSWFGEPRCKLGSKVVQKGKPIKDRLFIIFHCFSLFSLFFKDFFSLVLEVKIVQEWKIFHVLRSTLLSAHHHSTFEHI
jgi:hypothetical protein